MARKGEWGSQHDWEQEQDDLAKLNLHQDELCDGPGCCDYCDAAELEREKEETPWNKR